MSHPDLISMLIQAIQARDLRRVAQIANGLAVGERSAVMTPVLTQLASTDLASARWYLKLLAPQVREPLQRGITEAALEVLQSQGYQSGSDYLLRQEELWIRPLPLAELAQKEDPFTALLVTEFCHCWEDP